MTRIRSAATFLFAAVLLLGACHGAAKKADPVADRVLAKAAMPTAADLPGYSAAPGKGPVAIPAAAKRTFATCLATTVTIFDDVPGVDTAYSSDFSKEGAVLQSNVRIEAKQGDTDRLWKQLASTEIEPCLQRLFADALRQVAPANGSTVTTAAGASLGVTFDTLVSKFAVAVGERSIGFATKISSPADKAAFYVDLVFVTRGRAVIDVTTFADGKPFDRAQEIAVARTIYNRIGDHAN
jgi:hypothetical protein